VVDVIGDIHMCIGEALRWLPVDYDFIVKGSAAPADRFSPSCQVISTPVLCLVQLLLPCIFASKCVVAL
jgi:hypothetical protein